MNILTDTLPTAVLISGVEVPINSDFRAALRVILAYEDPDITTFEKQAILLGALYADQPPDLVEACKMAVKFLDGGTVDEEGEEGDDMRLCSFEKDANLIYAAFQQTHGIDLQTVQGLHWWKFLALFQDLGADTAFCQLVNLRRRVKTGKASKEEREAARNMGDAFDVPELDTRTLEEREKEAEFMKLVGKA